MQKIAEQVPSGDKPHIMISGHFHTSLYFFYRLMHIFNAGCFEGQSTFLARKGINPAIGGWTVKVRLANDKKKTILSCTPSFIPFLKRD
jgi:DNA polymerase II small subunit/DNA polymerase delta subunit B